MREKEIGKLSDKMRDFLRVMEAVHPSRFITNALEWSHLGRPMSSREKLIRAFFLKAVYDFPTTKPHCIVWLAFLPDYVSWFHFGAIVFDKPCWDLDIIEYGKYAKQSF
jgi:hypothetical protein